MEQDSSPARIAARTGAAVGLIDHVTKDPTSRGRWAIGGQAKMSGLTGASYMVEVARIFGEGLCGEVVLRLGKDRPGTLKRHCGPVRKSDKTQEAARIVIDSTDGHHGGDRQPVEGLDGGRGGTTGTVPAHRADGAGQPRDRGPSTRTHQERGGDADPREQGGPVDGRRPPGGGGLREKGDGSRASALRVVNYYREANDPLSENYSTLRDRLHDAHEDERAQG